MLYHTVNWDNIICFLIEGIAFFSIGWGDRIFNSTTPHTEVGFAPQETCL
ncbi:MAG: hypothetical protein RMZ41_016170 [Nostoc sp. DedVER02]|nr:MULTISPECIES: hypothetical protein [unclassified Nostoc]MDZ7984669.1 hypothetical protein [Nostoc sp. DedVER02]MDZ8113754.1 hypothetical protein [Nostoc sp. DedVER01b]